MAGNVIDLARTIFRRHCGGAPRVVESPSPKIKAALTSGRVIFGVSPCHLRRKKKVRVRSKESIAARYRELTTSGDTCWRTERDEDFNSRGYRAIAPGGEDVVFAARVAAEHHGK